jgi:hypothetical protein
MKLIMSEDDMKVVTHVFIISLITIAFLLAGCADTGMDPLNEGDDSENMDDTVGPPDEITLLTSNVTAREFSLEWTNPANSDFSHAELSWSPSHGEDQPKNVFGTPALTSETTVTGLETNTSYDVLIRTVDADGNASAGINVSLHTKRMWKLIGNPGFSDGDILFSTLAFDPTGTPYAAYQDRANDSKGTVMVLNGSTWGSAGNQAFTDGLIYENNLVFDSMNRAIFGFVDNTNSHGASVARLENGNWEYLGQKGFSEGGVNWIDLAIDSNNIVYVVYRDVANEYKASVMRYNSGTWEYPMGLKGVSPGKANSTCIEITSGDNPRIAFIEGENNFNAKVYHMSEANNDWWPIGFSYPHIPSCEYSSLGFALESSNYSYVAFQDGSMDGKMTVMRFTPYSTWETVGSPGITKGKAFDIHLAFDSEGDPELGYLYAACSDSGDTSRTSVYRYSESEGWTLLGNEGLDDYDTLQAFALDSNDCPCVLVEDVSEDYRASVMRYE